MTPAWLLFFATGAFGQTTPIAASTAAPSRPLAESPTKQAESKPAAAPQIEVLEVAFAAGISSRTPVGKATSFDESVGQVYFWNRVRVLKTPAVIKHVWYFNNSHVADNTFVIHYPSSRIWSKRRIRAGQWRVDVTDEAGNIVTVTAFPVTAASAAPPPKKQPEDGGQFPTQQ